MDCSTVNKKLSAYLDGELPGAEMAEVGEHIAACPVCGPAFEELEKTSAHIRKLEEVEPPEWLEQRIMAKVREEADTKRGVFHKLFFPLRIKVPLQAAATLAVCVIAFMVFRAVEPEMKESHPKQKKTIVSEEAKEEVLTEDRVRTKDVSKSGAGGYAEIESPSSPSTGKLDMALEKFRAQKEQELTTLGALKQESGTSGTQGFTPENGSPSASAKLFNARRETAEAKEETFRAEVVRFGSPPEDDTVIEVLFRRTDSGELFCAGFPSTHDLSRFIIGFRGNTLPEIRITVGPPYRGDCLLYNWSRQVINWERLEKAN